MAQKPTTLALIVGTRDFFPAEPVLAARRDVFALLQAKGVDVVIPDETGEQHGRSRNLGGRQALGRPLRAPTATSSTAC